jgi:enamine deaminase RidA (YjgF/YER057c/UK114 family)
MAKAIEHVHWPDAPDMWMPYAPAIKVKGGTTVYLAGVTAAPVYHHHPHRPEEFDAMPRDMEGQARAALENLKRGLEAVGATFADVVTADRFVTDLSDQDALKGKGKSGPTLTPQNSGTTNGLISISALNANPNTQHTTANGTRRRSIGARSPPATPQAPQPSICQGVHQPWPRKKFDASAARAPVANPARGPSAAPEATVVTVTG